METLFAIGMLVGLMHYHAPPPKPAAVPAVQRPVLAETSPPRKKSEWLLGY